MAHSPNPCPSSVLLDTPAHGPALAIAGDRGTKDAAKGSVAKRNSAQAFWMIYIWIFSYNCCSSIILNELMDRQQLVRESNVAAKVRPVPCVRETRCGAGTALRGPCFPLSSRVRAQWARTLATPIPGFSNETTLKLGFLQCHRASEAAIFSERQSLGKHSYSKASGNIA